MRRPALGPAGARDAALVAGIFLTLCSLACGSSFTPSPAKRTRDAQPVASVYDFQVSVPGMSFPQFLEEGLFVDLTLEIDPASIQESFFEARITILEIRVGGIVRDFVADDPLLADGRTEGVEFSVDSFGPIDLGDSSGGVTSLFLSMTGTLSEEGRIIDGMVVVTSSGETGTFHAVKQRRYLVASTDLGVTGTVSLVRVRYDMDFSVERDLEAISGDPVARAGGGSVFIVNRFFFDNIQSLDPASGFATALQFSTGNGSNPHDVLAVDPNRLYITRYEPPYNDILIADRSDGSSLGFIELAFYATNPSGTPRADSLVQVEGRIIASLQNIDGSFLEYGPGVLVSIDPGTDHAVSNILLVGRNPFGPPAVHPVTGRLYYAMAGVFEGSLQRELSGGIEVVDPASLTTLGLLIDDDDLGGNDVSAVALARAGRDTDGNVIIRGYCVVTLASGRNVVRSFDPETGTIAPGNLWESASFLPSLVADGDGYLILAVSDIADPRLVVINTATGTVMGSPRLTLPPFSVAVLTSGFLTN